MFETLKTRGKVAAGGALTGLALLALTTGSLFAQEPAPGEVPTHEQMHQMMDAVHGEGTSQRMHEAMGPNGEEIMDQCVSMMGMMQGMGNAMGGGGMSDMMRGGAMAGMMGQ